MGVAIVTMLRARRSQFHQATLPSHVHQWSFEMTQRLRLWTDHFVNHGADTFTANQQAMAMLYRETVTQAHILSYADDFWFLRAVYSSVLLPDSLHAAGSESAARDHGLSAPVD